MVRADRGTRRRAGDLGGQVLGAHLGPGRQHREPAAKIDQLTDIAGPGVGLERRTRIRRERLGVHAHLGGGDAQVMGEQIGHILAARPQRRQLHADHVQPMEEVLAEEAARHAVLEVLVGGSDDAHIDAHRGLAADAIEFAFGQHPQQARLQRRRHVADLVEEQRAAVSLLETPAALRVGAGERAFLVAEELRLQQLRGDRRGVERDERPRGARAVVVQRAGHELLAGARLAGDEHRRRGTRQPPDGAEHLLHRRRLAEQVRAPTFGVRFGARPTEALRRAAHQLDHLVDIEGFRQILEGAAFVGGDRVVEVGVGGHHDDRQLRPCRVDAAQHLETRLPRHADVGHQHIGSIGAKRLQRRLRRLEEPRQHATALQGALEHPPDGGVIVDQPDAQRTGAHGAPSAPNGSVTANTVRPRSLSNSMWPPLRVTISCATASPRPVPLARPVTSG